MSLLKEFFPDETEAERNEKAQKAGSLSGRSVLGPLDEFYENIYPWSSQEEKNSWNNGYRHPARIEDEDADEEDDSEEEEQEQDYYDEEDDDYDDYDDEPTYVSRSEPEPEPEPFKILTHTSVRRDRPGLGHTISKTKMVFNTEADYERHRRMMAAMGIPMQEEDDEIDDPDGLINITEDLTSGDGLKVLRGLFNLLSLPDKE